MIRLHLVLYLIVSGIVVIPISNGANGTIPFIFPYVKPDPYPVLIQSSRGALNNFTKVSSSTGNSFALVYVTVPPGAGPGPHIHHLTDEWFYFPEGGLVIFSSDQQYPDPSKIPNGIQLPKANMHRYHTKPGDLIYGPAFYVHGFRNEGNVSRLVIVVWAPDVITQYFFEAGKVVTDPCKLHPIGDINTDLFVSQAPKYGINMSSYRDEYVASWNDDWQPSLGMDAHGQELLDLLSNTSAQYVPCQALPSHATWLQSSFIFIYSIAFIVVGMLSVFA